MPFTLTMPKLSPTMEEGTITKWVTKEGDKIRAGDILFEVATDKATVEHAALDDGFLRKILIQNGGEATVGQPIAIFSLEQTEDISSYQPEGIAPQREEKEPEEKAVVQEEKPVQEKIEVRSTPMQQPGFAPEPPLENYVFPFPCSKNGATAASPYAKKLAEEKGIDLSTIKGTGPRGRIESRDLALAPATGSLFFGRKESLDLPPGSYEEESLTPMRKAIATRLQQAKSFIPHFYVTHTIQAEPIIALREQLKMGGVKITVNDLIVRATALALREHPVINSGFNSVSQKIIRFKTIDISIAVTVAEGLITPIVRQADYKNLGQISAEIRQLAEKAKAGKLAREEYVGGSFSISNLGMFGISSFRGIVNPPQGAILCVGGIEEKAVVRQGVVVPGKEITLSLSADHRVIDGSDGAKFLKSLQTLLENPALLLL